MGDEVLRLLEGYGEVKHFSFVIGMYGQPRGFAFASFAQTKQADMGRLGGGKGEEKNLALLTLVWFWMVVFEGISEHDLSMKTVDYSKPLPTSNH